jgi:hypothetical protein
MKLDAFGAYCLFMSLRNHFTQEKYCYFKYRGKIKATKEAFMINKDRFKFSKISKKYDEDALRDFYVANFIAGKKWIGDFFEEDAEDNYREYMKRKQSFTYVFQNQISRLFSDANPKEAFSIRDRQYPKIIDVYLEGDLSIEVLAVLNTFIKFSGKFDERLGKDDIIWSKISFLIRKIEPFLQYDKSKIKNILKECI